MPVFSNKDKIEKLVVLEGVDMRKDSIGRLDSERASLTEIYLRIYDYKSFHNI